MKPKSFNIPKAFFPNSFTALNALCGFLSIVQSSLGDFDWAFYFIIFGSLFDLFDGMIARMVKTSSSFGVQLDSLSDVITFGLAPSFLIYQAHFYEFGWGGALISGIFVVFGALRLARFNTQVTDYSLKTDFRGLPIPIAALTLTSYVWNFNRNGEFIEPYNYFVIPLIILLSLLMVSTVKYNALPKFTFGSLKEKPVFITYLVLSVAATIYSKGSLLFYVFFVLVLFGIFRWFFYTFSNSKEDSNNIIEETN